MPVLSNAPILGDYDKIERFAEELDDASPGAILRWALSRYAPRLAVVSNYGPGTLVVIHHAVELDPTVPVIHVDTGYEFPETAELGRRLEARYGVRIVHAKPERTPDEQAREFGSDLYKTDPDFCCHMRKVEPLAQALTGFDAWVTGVRRSQAATRRSARVVEWDARHDCVKVNPLARWSKEDVWNFILKHDIPYNPLHDAGYPSIGCAPCTRAVVEGEDERAGRWSGSDKTECGIHVAHFAPRPSHAL